MTRTGTSTRRARRARTTTSIALAAAALAALPAAASATVTPKTADMNGGGFAGFEQTNISQGALTVDGSRTYEGSGAAHATYTGGGTNGFSRGLFELGWSTGDDVWFGGAFYLPTGFKAAMQSETDLMRYDNFGSGSTTDYGGIGLLKTDGKAHLYRLAGYVNGQPGSGTGEDMNVVAPFDLPEGRWFWLEVHQRLGTQDGSAVNEVYVDDAKVASSTKANTFGRGATRLRYGIVSIGETKQTRPLELWFDPAMVRGSRIGALGGSAVPAPGSGAGSTTGGSGSGSGSGSGTGTGDAGTPASGGSTTAPVRVQRPHIRHGRLRFRVVARKGAVKRTQYRLSTRAQYRAYRGAIRLTAAQRRKATVRVRVTLADRTSALVRLAVRHGRVTAR